MGEEGRGKALSFFLTSVLVGGWGSGQYHALAALPPGRSSGTHCTGNWVSLGAT